MKNIIHILIATAVFMAACKHKSQHKPQAVAPKPVYRWQVAEFEPTEAVWLIWGKYDHKRGFSNAKASLDIMDALLPHTKICLVVPNDSVRHWVSTKLPAEALSSGKIRFFESDYNEFWARDMGPTFVRDTASNLSMVDFNFSGWGYTTPKDSAIFADEKLDENIAKALNLPIVSTDMVTEGGDHETNGKGIFLLCEAVEMTRNPQMSKAQIEENFRKHLGAKQVVWMKEGLYEDDHCNRGPIRGPRGKKYYNVVTTNGHVDEFVRFVAEDMVLLAEVDSLELLEGDPIAMENKRRLDENLRILQAFRTAAGKPLRIRRIPLPKAIFGTMSKGDAVYDIISEMHHPPDAPFPKNKTINVIAAASYLNFLIANDCVLMPFYWKKGMGNDVKKRDAAAKAILQGIFPDKKIIPLDVLSVNWGGGGIHCITRNQPKI
jgi:agmatine deiminase